MTQQNEQGVYFKKLTPSEKKSKLSSLSSRASNNLTVWLKGKTDKYNLKSLKFHQRKNELEVLGTLPSELLNKEVLVTFEIRGLHFFGECLFENKVDEIYVLSFLKDLFKSERRSNFRLLTFPHQEVYLFVKIAQESSVKKNLLYLNSAADEKKLFKNFLDLVSDSREEKVRDDYLKLRVLDISVTGLAMQVGENENEIIGNLPCEPEDLYLDFNGEFIEIPKVSILHKTKKNARDKGVILYKYGLKFREVDINLDEKLSRLINKTLRDLESEFEAFLV